MMQTIHAGKKRMQRPEATTVTRGTNLQDPSLVHDVFTDVRVAPAWLLLRVALGWFWLQAGWNWLQARSWPGLAPVDRGVGVTGDTRAIALTLVGVMLILGLLVGPGAFAGGCLMASFWSGGSEFPVLQFAAVVVLILAWKTAGWIGLDRWLLPLLGLPWRSGALFGQSRWVRPGGKHERTVS